MYISLTSRLSLHQMTSLFMLHNWRCEQIKTKNQYVTVTSVLALANVGGLQEFAVGTSAAIIIHCLLFEASSLLTYLCVET